MSIEDKIKEAEILLKKYQRFGEGLTTKALRQGINKLKNKL